MCNLFALIKQKTEKSIFGFDYFNIQIYKNKKRTQSAPPTSTVEILGKSSSVLFW